MSGPTPLDVLRQFSDSDGLPYETVAAVAELVRRSCEMLEQDQCRFATYNAAPHMATAVDNLRAALAKFGGAA